MEEKGEKEGEVLVEKGEVEPEQMKELAAGEFLTPSEVAGKLKYSYQWVIWLLKAGRIKGIKPLGGRWRIPSSEYDRIEKEGIPTMPRAQPVKPPVTVLTVDEKAEKMVKEPEKKGDEKPPFQFDLDFFGRK